MVMSSSFAPDAGLADPARAAAGAGAGVGSSRLEGASAAGFAGCWQATHHEASTNRTGAIRGMTIALLKGGLHLPKPAVKQG
jgi:hypothetical protein